MIQKRINNVYYAGYDKDIKLWKCNFKFRLLFWKINIVFWTGVLL